MPPVIWAEIRQAVERGDTEALGQALADVRHELEGNLRLRLDAKPEYREPVSELRVVGAADPVFHQARELLLRRDPRALAEFADLHYRRNANTIDQEWYAYALTLFGQARTSTTSSSSRPPSPPTARARGWTARWNLPARSGVCRPGPMRRWTCCCQCWTSMRTAGLSSACSGPSSRAADALGRSACARGTTRPLLAALLDAEPSGQGGGARFRDHFRRINRILRDRTGLPDPGSACCSRSSIN